MTRRRWAPSQPSRTPLRRRGAHSTRFERPTAHADALTASRVVSSPPRVDAALWIDLLSCPDVLFFEGLLDGFDAPSVSLTLREKNRTAPLADAVGFDYSVIGRDFDHTFLRKLGIPLRTLQLFGVSSCDVSLSLRNAMCILVSKARGVPSIHFTDNDATAYTEGLWAERLYNRLEAQATYNVVPAAFDTRVLTEAGADPDSIYTYDGYKEDLYVAAFEPESGFTQCLPFDEDEYVVVRSEALTAAYTDGRSIVPELLAELVDRGFDVVYLPRGRGDEDHALSYSDDQVFVPTNPIHGLQLAWHARCVLTGSGTMAREAASMDKPAVSFFPSPLLSVDRELVADGRIYHSRDPVAIGDYLDSLTARELRPTLDRASTGRNEILDITTRLIDSAGARNPLGCSVPRD